MPSEIIIDSIIDILTRPWEHPSVVWIIISGIVGSVITQVLKLVFEQTVPQWQQKRANRTAIRKYHYPLSDAALSLSKSLLLHILNQQNDKFIDDHYHLNILYNIGRFFGWCKILEDESFLEYLQTERTKELKESLDRYWGNEEPINKQNKISFGLKFTVPKTSYVIELMKFEWIRNLDKGRVFSIFFNEVFESISSQHFFYDGDHNIFPESEIKLATVPKFVLSAIGEIMTKDSNATDQKFRRIIGFAEFVQNYKTNDSYRTWFSYFENLLFGINHHSDDVKWNRLVIFLNYLILFLHFLEPGLRTSLKLLLSRTSLIFYVNPDVLKKLISDNNYLFTGKL